jgi:hypothetical protein
LTHDQCLGAASLLVEDFRSISQGPCPTETCIWNVWEQDEELLTYLEYTLRERKKIELPHLCFSCLEFVKTERFPSDND